MTKRKRRNQFRHTQKKGRQELKLLGGLQKKKNGEVVINGRQSQGLVVTLWTTNNPQSGPDGDDDDDDGDGPTDMWAA